MYSLTKAVAINLGFFNCMLALKTVYKYRVIVKAGTIVVLNISSQYECFFYFRHVLYNISIAFFETCQYHYMLVSVMRCLQYACVRRMKIVYLSWKEIYTCLSVKVHVSISLC